MIIHIVYNVDSMERGCCVRPVYGCTVINVCEHKSLRAGGHDGKGQGMAAMAFFPSIAPQPLPLLRNAVHPTYYYYYYMKLCCIVYLLYVVIV